MNTVGKKILLVEDEVIIAMNEKMSLEKYGYAVEMANNGENAIAYLESHPVIDIILMDINLGSGMLGTEAADAILSKKDIPLIFLSSHAEKEVVEKTEGITSYGYVIKNSNISVLDTSIKMALKLFYEKQKVAEKHRELEKKNNELERTNENLARTVRERERAEKSILQMKRLYATLSQVNQTIVRVRNHEELYQSICKVSTQFGEFLLAWIGLLDESSGDIKPVAANGLDLADWPFPIVNIHQGAFMNGLAATAIRLSKVVTSEDIEVDTRTRLLHDQLSSYGYHSSATVPFRLRGKTVGVLNLISREKGLFKAQEETRLLEEMGLDISFALDTMETESERGRAVKAQEESELKYSVLFHKSAIASVIAKIPELTCVDVNEAFERMFGYSRVDMIGNTALSVGLIRPEARGRMLTEFQDKGSLQTYEQQLFTKSNEALTVLLNVNPLEIEGRKFTITTMQDITERKKAEDEIKRQLSEKETLLKETHHRIKNNIASIEGLLELQADATQNADIRFALREAIGRVQGIRVFYEKLLIANDYQQVLMKEYIESLIESLVQMFPEITHISIQSNITDFALDSKKAIPVGIIVNELMTNTYKHAFVGMDAGTISIDLAKTDTRVVLIIQDNGVGIASKADTTKTPGFGLTIVKMLAEQLKGSFRIQNHQGTKSVLEFDL